MTSQKIKFYKFNNSTTSATKIATAKATEGAVIYLVDVRELWIGGATANDAKLVIKGANDVTFTNNVLTLTHYDNAGAATTQTLDFSDVASAQATFKVFDSVWSKMGATTSGSSKVLDYTGTNYLTSATNLVDADKALDTAIHTNTHKGAATGAVYDTEHLSPTWINVVNTNAIAANDTLDVDIDKLDKKIAGLADEVIAKEQVTQEAFTAVANSVGLESDMSLDLSDANLTVIKNDTSVKEALEDLDAAIAAIDAPVDDVKINGTSIVDNNDIANIAVDGTYDATDNKIASKSTVTSAIQALDVNEYAQAEIDTTTISGETAFKVKGIKEVDGKIAAGTNTVDVKIDGTYDATDNMIATESTVTNAINNLNVNTDKGAASISGSTITINAVQQENGLIKDGGSTIINLDGTYDATDNKIATKSTVSNAIDGIAGAGLAVASDGTVTATTQSTSDDQANVATTEFVHNVVETLDTTNDVQAVDYTAATSSTGAKLTFKGVSETDGVIAQGSGTTELRFAKVATTGAAADVTYTNTTSGMTATDVQAAIDELDGRVDSLVGGMRYNGDINTTTAPVNTSTGDIRSGDIYLASGPITIGTTSVEAGDMIVYKGATSTDPVTLTASNCTIIERETDTMVTAGDTLTDDYIVFGSGNKEVSVTSTVDAANYQVSASDLKTAITNANSALQTISHGTDGTYVTTTIGSKDANNDQSVGVEVAQSTVTYTAKDGDTPANLTATNGLLNESAITPIKSYVDAKVGTAIQSVDGSATEKAKSVEQSGYAAVKVTATTDNDKNVTLDTVVGLTVQAVSSADSTHMGLAEASDVKSYVDGVVDGLDVTGYAQAAIDTTTTSGQTTFTVNGISETNGKIAADTTNNKNLVIDGTYDALTNKIATQSTVSGIVENLDVDEYAQASVTAANGGTTITVKGIKEENGEIAASTSSADTTILADGEYNASNNKLATQSTVTTAISGLDADITSDDAAVADVEVKQVDGVITDVVVTTNAAGVSYTASGASTQPGLTATDTNGAVTGGDIAAIKSYVDDKVQNACWEEYE